MSGLRVWGLKECLGYDQMLAERKRVMIAKPFLHKLLQHLRDFPSVFWLVLDIEVVNLVVSQSFVAWLKEFGLKLWFLGSKC